MKVPILKRVVAAVASTAMAFAFLGVVSTAMHADHDTTATSPPAPQEHDWG